MAPLVVPSERLYVERAGGWGQLIWGQLICSLSVSENWRVAKAKKTGHLQLVAHATEARLVGAAARATSHVGPVPPAAAPSPRAITHVAPALPAAAPGHTSPRVWRESTATVAQLGRVESGGLGTLG